MKYSNEPGKPRDTGVEALKGKERIFYLDVLRVLACFLVLVNHTNSSIFKGRGPSATWYLSLAYFFVSKSAVPLFLMIMGAVQLSRTESKTKYHARIRKTLVVILSFTIFYLADAVLRKGATVTPAIAVQKLMNSPSRALWYLYLYLGLSLFIPFFQKLAGALSREEEKWLCLLSAGLNGLLPMLPVFTGIGLNGIFYSGTLSVYIGLVFLGHYLHTYVSPRKSQALAATALYLLLVTGQVILTAYLYTLDHKDYLKLDNRIFLPITAGAACFFLLVKFLCANTVRPESPVLKGIQAGVSSIAGLTFGIYLFGDWLIDLFRPLFRSLEGILHPLPAVLIYETAVFTAGALLTAILQKLPATGKYLR